MLGLLLTFTAARENSCANSFARDRAIILQQGRNICPSIPRCAAELHALSTRMVIFVLRLVAVVPEHVLKREGEMKQRKGREVHQKKKSYWLSYPVLGALVIVCMCSVFLSLFLLIFLSPSPPPMLK